MHTATLEARHVAAHAPTGPRHPAARPAHGAGHAELRTAHVEVAHSIAGMELDDYRLWGRMDPVVARVVSEAYEVTAALTGQPAATPATGVPPVVRVRELASAQARLFTALDRRQPPEAVTHRSVHLLRALHGRLFGDVPRR
jgi:hypothetical protein